MSEQVVIECLRLEGFGQFGGLELSPSPKLHLFYGANEAGKSTLLGFVRSILFGFERRGAAARYEPLQGVHGGEVMLQTPLGELHVRRTAGRRSEGEVVVRTPGGERVAEAKLAEVLGGVSRELFGEVFAFSLEELSSFERLAKQSTVSQALLAAGLQGARRLPEALERLKRDADRVYVPRGRRELNQLLAELGQVTERLERAGDRPAHYFSAVLEREETRGALVAASADRRLGEEEKARTQRQLDAELLLARWEADRRALSGSEDLKDFPAGGLERLEALLSRQEKVGSEQARVRSEMEVVDAGLAALPDLPDLRRALSAAERFVASRAQDRALLSRRAALAERTRALASALSEIHAEDDLAALEVRSFPPAARARLCAGGEMLQEAERRNRMTVETAAIAMSALERAEEAWRGARDGCAQERGEPLEKLDAGKAALSQLGSAQEDLAIASATLREAQEARRSMRPPVNAGPSLGPWVRRGLGLLAVVLASGALIALVLAGGWSRVLIAVAGAVGAVICVFAGRAIGRRTADAMAQAAVELRAREIELARLLRLEEALHRREAAVRTRLEGLAAQAGVSVRASPEEQRRRETELLVAIEQVRREERQEHEAAELLTEVERCRGTAERARATDQRAREQAEVESRRWTELLGRERLPPGISPPEAINLWGRLAELRQRWIDLKADQEALRAEEAEVEAAGRNLLEAGRELGWEDDDAALVAARLQAAAEAARATREREKRLEERTADLRAQTVRWSCEAEEAERALHALLVLGGCTDVEVFRRRARDAQAYVEAARRTRDLAAQVEALSGLPCVELRKVLDQAGGREGIRLSLERQEGALEVLSGRVEALARKEGELSVLLKGWEEDQEIARQRGRQEELRVRAAELLERFTIDSLALALLERAQEVHRREHQPRLVQRASEHFWGLTRGRYGRVWAEADGRLRVLDSQKREWSADALSRGTREQLFLAFRLALVNDLCERKPALPLVLDDILVNFDPERAEAAIEAFARMAARHQVLALTCHPWVRDLFVAHGAQVTELGESLPSARRLATAPSQGDGGLAGALGDRGVASR